MFHYKALFLTATFATSLFSQASNRPELPNFMFIMSDDLGWQDVRCYDVDDNAVFDTPYMDALAKEGVQFWQAYSPAAVCAPSRGSALTGLHPVKTGLTSVGGGKCTKPIWPHSRVIPAYTNHQLDNKFVTIPEALAPLGYLNGHAGKWHLIGRAGSPTPLEQGFHWSKQNRGIHHTVGGNVDHRYSEFGTNEPGDPYKLDENGFAHDQNLQDALDFVSHATEEQKPFFCYFATYIVHAPNVVRTESLVKKYAARMGYDYPLTPDVEFPEGQNNPFYAAMVERFDYNVHRVVEQLKTTDDPRWPGHKLIENTYIFITSDNGGMEWDQEYATDNFPLDKGKVNQQEGGIRVPFFILGPDVPAGVESDVMINGLDIMPTILNLAGTTSDTELDGCDLTTLITTDPTDAALVKENDGSVRDTMFWHFPHSVTLNTAIRKDRWKLIYNYDHINNPERNEYWLYELYQKDGSAKDLNEAVDVAAQYPEKTQELATELHQRLQDADAIPAYLNPRCPAPLPHQEEVAKILETGQEGRTVWAQCAPDTARVTKARLHYTLNGGAGLHREDWFIAPATFTADGRVTATLPEGTTHYVFNIIDENNFLISYPDLGARIDPKKTTKVDSELALSVN